ncbi:MAG: glycosyltransferase [Cyanobacteria bacterium J06639_14]
MITITLGTIPFPFSRAIDWIFDLLQQNIITEPVFLQHGISDISKLGRHPLVTAMPKTSYQHLVAMTQQSRLVISHAGQGSTRDLSNRGIQFVLLPRLAQYKEHIDDHQLTFAESILPQRDYYCLSREELAAAIQFPPPALEHPLLMGPDLSQYLRSVYAPAITRRVVSQTESCLR